MKPVFIVGFLTANKDVPGLRTAQNIVIGEILSIGMKGLSPSGTVHRAFGSGIMTITADRYGELDGFVGVLRSAG